MNEEPRKFDWLLDIVAPYAGAIISAAIFYTVMRLTGCM